MPHYSKNSMMTSTTKNLSQHEYHANDYLEDHNLRGSLRAMTQNLNRVSGDLRRSLLMEDENNARQNAMRHHHSMGELNEALTDKLNTYKPPDDIYTSTSWYTKPIHLTADVRIPMQSEDMMADQYFPITLGASKSLELVGSIRPAKGKTRPAKAKAVKIEPAIKEDHRRLDNIYLMTADAPFIKTAGITFTSPYSEELSKLRMEKLRIEEKQYLELKRQAELERIRGPKSKWYESKGPEFHYEAKKNNDLLRNSLKWDELLCYRENLLDASTRLKLALDNYSVPSY